MTDATDAALGAVTGILAVGVMANVASKFLGGSSKGKSKGKGNVGDWWK